MNIIIAGAGDVGFHLAKLLSIESQNIYIIDNNAERLEYVNNHIDVITNKGDATSTSLLEKSIIFTNIFIFIIFSSALCFPSLASI